jgi:hypothetical protein
MATTAKNAYEIRSDLLGLAKDLADFNYQRTISARATNTQVRKDGEQVVQEFKAPTLYPLKISLKQLKKFNDFVTSGDSFEHDSKKLSQKMYEEGLKNSKPFADAYQNTVKAFFPNLKNGK